MVRKLGFRGLLREWLIIFFALVVLLAIVFGLGMIFISSCCIFDLSTIVVLLIALLFIPSFVLFMGDYSIKSHENDKTNFARILPQVNALYAWVVILCIMMSLVSSKALQSGLFTASEQAFAYLVAFFLSLLAAVALKVFFLKKRFDVSSMIIISLVVFFGFLALAAFAGINQGFALMTSIVLAFMTFITFRAIFLEKRVSQDAKVVISLFGFGFFAVVTLMVAIDIFFVRKSVFSLETAVPLIFMIYGVIQALAVAFLIRFSPNVLTEIFVTRTPKISKTLIVSALAIILFAIQFILGLPWFYNSLQTIAITAIVAKEVNLDYIEVKSNSK